jgi:Na+/H+ antiporter NhaD/arsenite permease-like protein
MKSLPFCFKGFLISVAYSSAIGGLATLVGTGPNIFVKGYTDE